MISKLPEYPEYNNKEEIPIPLLFCKKLIYSNKNNGFTANYLQKILLKNTPNRIIGKVHRRSGATSAIELLALWGAYCNSNYRVYVIDELGMVLQNTLYTISNNKFIHESISSIDEKSNRYITFNNGSSIQYTRISLVGFDTRCSAHKNLILINNMELMTQAVFKSLRPMLIGDIYHKEPEVLMLGTPSPNVTYYSDGSEPFYDMWIENNGFLKFHLPVTNNPEISKESIISFERALGERSFQAEFMAMFKTKDGYV